MDRNYAIKHSEPNPIHSKFFAFVKFQFVELFSIEHRRGGYHPPDSRMLQIRRKPMWNRNILLPGG